MTDTLQTRTGFSFTVRPASPDDGEALTEFFEHVSRDDLRFRFLSAVHHVSEGQIDAMTHADHVGYEDFVAKSLTGDAIIANATLAIDQSLSTAEVAISIHSDFKGKGIGWTLLDYVARYVKSRGIKTLHSIESRDNHATIELEREMGFKATSYEGDATLVKLEAQLQD